jgi:hypothetical protein
MSLLIISPSRLGEELAQEKNAVVQRILIRHSMGIYSSSREAIRRPAVSAESCHHDRDNSAILLYHLMESLQEDVKSWTKSDPPKWQRFTFAKFMQARSSARETRKIARASGDCLNVIE